MWKKILWILARRLTEVTYITQKKLKRKHKIKLFNEANKWTQRTEIGKFSKPKYDWRGKEENIIEKGNAGKEGWRG